MGDIGLNSTDRDQLLLTRFGSESSDFYSRVPLETREAGFYWIAESDVDDWSSESGRHVIPDIAAIYLTAGRLDSSGRHRVYDKAWAAYSDLYQAWIKAASQPKAPVFPLEFRIQARSPLVSREVGAAAWVRGDGPNSMISHPSKVPPAVFDLLTGEKSGPNLKHYQTLCQAGRDLIRAWDMVYEKNTCPLPPVRTLGTFEAFATRMPTGENGPLPAWSWTTPHTNEPVSSMHQSHMLPARVYRLLNGGSESPDGEFMTYQSRSEALLAMHQAYATATEMYGIARHAQVLVCTQRERVRQIAINGAAIVGMSAVRPTLADESVPGLLRAIAVKSMVGMVDELFVDRSDTVYLVSIKEIVDEARASGVPIVWANGEARPDDSPRGRTERY